MTAAVSARIAACLVVVAAAGHALAIPHHADPGHGGSLYGASFAAVAVAQLVAAGAMARRPADNRLRQVAIVSSLLLAALWMVSRTRGLPFGPHAGVPEVVGVLDAMTIAAQLGVVGLLVQRDRRRLPMALASSFAVVVVGVAAFNIADVEVTGATPHTRAGSDASRDDLSQVGGGERSPESAVTPPHKDGDERGDVVDTHAHGARPHAHP